MAEDAVKGVGYLDRKTDYRPRPPSRVSDACISSMLNDQLFGCQTFLSVIYIKGSKIVEKGKQNPDHCTLRTEMQWTCIHYLCLTRLLSYSLRKRRKRAA